MSEKMTISEVVRRLEANEKKFDGIVNGAEGHEENLGGKKTPSLRTLFSQITRATFLSECVQRACACAKHWALQANKIATSDAVISTGTTEARSLPDRFADVVNVKDFGAIGDGVTDDTAAFEAAAATGKSIFVPRGAYEVGQEIQNMIPKLTGEGELVLSHTGRRMTISPNVATSSNLAQQYLGMIQKLPYVKAIQNVSYCDGYIFITQSGTTTDDDYFHPDNIVSISQYVYSPVDDATALLHKSNNFYVDSSEVPTSWTPIKTVKVSGMGHEASCAVKHGNDIYIYGQVGSADETKKGNGFTRFKWPSGNESPTIEYYSPLKGLRDVLNYSYQSVVSEDGKYIVFTSTRDCVVYLLDDCLRNSATASPVSRFPFNEQYSFPRSGSCCDGRFIYILFSRFDASSRQFIKVYTMNGVFIRNIETDVFAAFIPRFVGTGNGGWVVFGRESEGLAMVSSKLCTGTKIYACKPTTVVTYQGRKYFTRNDLTNDTEPPLTSNQWIPLSSETAFTGASGGEWKSGSNYTGATDATARFYLTAIAPAETIRNDAPICFDFYDVTPISTDVNSRNGGPVTFGTVYKDAVYQQMASAIPGGIRFHHADGSTADITFDGSEISTSKAFGPTTFVKRQGTAKAIQLDWYNSPVGELAVLENYPIFRSHTAHLRLLTDMDSESTIGVQLTGSSTSQTYEVYPLTKGTMKLGRGSNLWSQVYAATDTISTSDRNEKQDIEAFPDEVLDAWGDVQFRQFLFNSAVEKKGDAARIHSGVIAQQVVEAFAARGLDATRYGLLCFDEWDDEYEAVEVVDKYAICDEQGNEISPIQTHTERRLVTAAGSRYGIRYSEALCLEAAYQRRRADRLEQRISAIEKILK